MSELPILVRARHHADAVAIRAAGRSTTYADLVQTATAWAGTLLNDVADLQEARVAVLLPAGPAYVAAQWAIWQAGGVFVPLSHAAADAELEYTLTDADVSLVVTDAAHRARLTPLCQRRNGRLLDIDQDLPEQHRPLPTVSTERRAMMLYTSGTTSRPKGVITTHANIVAQIESLVSAWEWQATDRIPLFLPLHHIHGIVNILGCALWSGAVVDAFGAFAIDAILERVRRDDYTVFMAVPTIYVKLLDWFKLADPSVRAATATAFRRLRLMVSGSAALPTSVHQEWERCTGQTLLERYGMTEIGMALSNPYRGSRRPGTVGQPLPGVEVRLVTETGAPATVDQPGEIQVRGAGVFKEYWRRPEISADAFADGWFRTGDMAVVDAGYYRILGRQSVDIIKSGGYKLSALEIEAVLLEHPAIRECAVVGIADDTWGEAVAAAIVVADATPLDIDALRQWCRDRLSVYKIPKHFKVVPTLPRNAIGKVSKPAVKTDFA